MPALPTFPPSPAPPAVHPFLLITTRSPPFNHATHHVPTSTFPCPSQLITFSSKAFFFGAGAAAPPATDWRRKEKSFSFFTSPAGAGTPVPLGGAKANAFPAGALKEGREGRRRDVRGGGRHRLRESPPAWSNHQYRWKCHKEDRNG